MKEYTPTEESYLSQLSSALRNGWTGFVSGIQQLTVWVVGVWPVLVILAAAAVLLLVRKANQTGAPLCAELIYGDSNTRLTFPLEKDADYDVDTGYLTVHIKIQDGAARFVDSPCPDHICESFGWLSEEDQTATCLPARAVLSIIPTT